MSPRGVPLILFCCRIVGKSQKDPGSFGLGVVETTFHEMGERDEGLLNSGAPI